MTSINRVFLAGNLTRDPQTKFLAGDKAVCEFGIAINRKFKGSDGEMKEEATFVEIVAWGRTAELCGQYLTKGSGAFIEGRLTQETWEDKKDGSKRSKTKVTADNVQFMGGKKDRQEGEQQEKAVPAPGPRRPAAPEPSGGGSDSDPPFQRRSEWE